VIVVDASVAVLALLDDGDARARLSSEPLAAPHLIDSEIAQALRTHVRRSEVRPTEARGAIESWAGLGLQRVAIVGLLARVWELRDNLTACDATYVAVAEALDCALVTADARLARAPGVRCPISLVHA
jgi:predicted nucleic acid-binding protein